MGSMHLLAAAARRPQVMLSVGPNESRAMIHPRFRVGPSGTEHGKLRCLQDRLVVSVVRRFLAAAVLLTFSAGPSVSSHSPVGTARLLADPGHTTHAGWRTYTDPDSSFTFRYPPKYYPSEGGSGLVLRDAGKASVRSETMFCYDPGGNRPSEQVVCDVTLFVFRNPDNLPVQGFVDAVLRLFSYGSFAPAEQDTLTDATGMAIYEYMFQGQAGRSVRLLSLRRRDVVVVLRGHWGDPLFQRGPGGKGDAQRRMLASFRFATRG